MASLQTMDSIDSSVCPICHEDEKIHAVTPCNHHICFKCSTRLRLLHQHYDCPICRADCELVLFVHDVHNYSSYQQRNFIKARRLKALFEDKVIDDAVNHLTAHDCYVCTSEGTEKSFKTFKQLQDHIRKLHQLFFCEICVQFVKLFSFERKAYSRQELGLHKRKGDPDDTSFKGHPLCQLCDKRFLDTDELWRHLRKDHYFCHFCDADGSHIYFGTYGDVKDHFREEHFLCEEGECANVEFTNSFRSQIDMIAHKAHSHPKSNKRTQQKQSRLLPVEINYAKENQRRPNRERHAARDDTADKVQETGSSKPPASDVKSTANAQEEIDIARAVTASLQQTTSTQNASIDVESALDFPSLLSDSATGSKSSNSSPRPQKKKNAAARMTGLVMVDDNEEFPGLSSAPLPSSASNPPPTASTSSGPEYAITTAKQSKKVVKPVAPAAVKAKSNPWGNTEDEFPTLEGAKAKPQVLGWHFSKPQPKPSRPAVVRNKKPVLHSVNDFPSLGSGASSSLASIGSWMRTNSKAPAPAPEIVSNRAVSSAPQVNHYTENSVSGVADKPVAKSKKEKAKKKEKQDSTISSLGKDGKLTKGAIAAADSKSNKKTSGEKSKNAAKGASATTKSTSNVKPMAEEKPVAEQKSIVGKEPTATAEKASSQKHQVPNGSVMTDRNITEDSTKSAAVTKKTSKPDVSRTILLADESDKAAPETSTSKAKSNNKGGKISKKMAALEADLENDDFPSLPVSKLTSAVSNKAKWDREEFPTLSLKPAEPSSDSPVIKSKDTELAVDLSKLSLDEYPSLSSLAGPTAVTGKPPPGLRPVVSPPVTLSPPPGLANIRPVSNGTTKPPGLGHNTPLDISSVASLITGSSVLAEPICYLEPVNFAQRNKKLSFKLKDLIYNDMTKFHKFKDFSVDFRGDKITAREFYDGCYKLLGKETFLEILPELLVLLPDIDKQQSLYTLCADELVKYEQEKSWSISDASLFQCAICNQVLLIHDAVHHETQHETNTVEYPIMASTTVRPATRKAW